MFERHMAKGHLISQGMEPGRELKSKFGEVSLHEGAKNIPYTAPNFPQTKTSEA